MILRRSRLGTWGRRNVPMMIFWYFAVIFSAFLYYTYAKWRPETMNSDLLDGPENSDMLSSQRAELRRILNENVFSAYRKGLDGDIKAIARAPAAADLQLPLPGGDSSVLGRLTKSSHLVAVPGSGFSNNRTRDTSSPGGGSQDKFTNADNAGRIETQNEVELTKMYTEEKDEEEEEDLKPPLASVVEGYEQVSSGEALRLHCGRCSVVSSSGHLINQSRGRDIDSAQCVLRMNSAPTVDYEDDVGARTTVRVIGHVNMIVLKSSREYQHEIFVNRSSRADKIVIPWLHSVRLNKKTNPSYKIAENFSKAFPEVEFYFLTPEKSKLAEEIFKSETGLTTIEANTWLSTGWMTLLFAIDVCDEIDIYGLVDESHCRDRPNDSTPYHYYDPNGKTECKYYQRSEERLTSGHLFITEKAIFARWALRFKFNFHTPAWNLRANPSTNASLALDTPFLKRFYEAKSNNRTVVVQTRKVVRRVVRRVVVRRKVPVAKKTKL